MAPRRKKVLEERSAQKTHAQQAIDSRHASTEDVRSKVEQQFTLMEQAHDRIRTQELATRLRDRDGRPYLL